MQTERKKRREVKLWVKKVCTEHERQELDWLGRIGKGDSMANNGALLFSAFNRRGMKRGGSFFPFFRGKALGYA